MSNIPTKSDNPNGLHTRYNVTKLSGEPVDPSAEYFVLRLDYGGKDENHIKACRVAINAYAMAIKAHIPKLATDIQEKYGCESHTLYPFSFLEYVKDYVNIIQNVLPEFEKELSHKRSGSASDRIHHILSQFRSIADTAILKAKNFIEDVKTQFKAIEIITEGLTRGELNHGQKRVIANHIITILREMIDRIDSIQWEYTDHLFERYNFFRSNTPERSLMERYRDIKRERDSLRSTLEEFKTKHKDLVDDLPF